MFVKMVGEYLRGGYGEDPGTPLFDQRAEPVLIRSENSPEFIAKAIKR
jgi:hypothetical protein